MPFKKKQFVYKPRTPEPWEARRHQDEVPLPPPKALKKIKYADPVEAGRKGGQARTEKKAQASRTNGRKGGKAGGRPSSRTLAERLLMQKLSPHQLTTVSNRNGLYSDEVNRLMEHFDSTLFDQYGAAQFRRKTARTPKTIRRIIQKFRLCSRHTLDDLGPAKPPRDYYVGTVQPSREEVHLWEQDPRHRGVPYPPRRRKSYFQDFPDFNLLVAAFKQNPNMTALDIAEYGSRYHAYSDQVLAYLQYRFKK